MTEGLDRVTQFSPAHRTVAPPAAGPPPLAQRVVLVLVEGLRADDAPFLPTLDWLGQQGAFLRLTAPSPGFAMPASATLLTGAPPQAHGVLFALPGQVLRTDSIPAAARRAQLTVAGAGSPAMGALLRPAVGDWRDVSSLAALQDQIGGLLAPGGARLVVLHTDYLFKESSKLHVADRQDSEYLHRLASLDALLSHVLEPIDWKSTAVVVAGTLGMDTKGRYDPTSPLPVIMAGPGIKPGYRGQGALEDMAPTLAALAGTPVPLANHGMPLLDALQATPGRPADLIVQRTLESRKVLTESALASLGTVQRVDDPPATAAGAADYLAKLDQQVRSARFATWKESLTAIWYYLAGGALAVLLYLLLVWRSAFGGPLVMGTITYGAVFHLLFFLTGGSYSAALSGLESPDRMLAWSIAFRAMGAMTVAVVAAGYLLSRKGFKRRGYLAMAACHLALSTAVVVALPVAVMVLFTGWAFPTTLPATGLVVWFFVAGLQAMAITALSPLWAAMTVAAASVSRRLWPIKEVGNPETNADKVVRLRALRRARRTHTRKG